jgi:hypothetical protein
MRPSVCAMVAALALVAGCVPPPSPAERLAFEAHEMNSATRFGRMDVALDHVAAEAQADFMRRHSKWGRDMRIVDLDVEGIHFIDSTTAEVNVTVSWHRLDEAELNASAVTQTWKHDSEGWKIVEEQRVGGAPGLFQSKAKRGSTSGSKGAADLFE